MALRQKCFLILFGVCLTFLGLEIVLRAGGFIFLALQEHQNKISLIKHGEYRILCLGESTTALGGEDAYPRQLEKILNSRQSKIQFTVINKGIPATTTNQIVLHLERYLNQYKPHMVITMIGANDVLEGLKPAVSMLPRWIQFFENFRIFKLVRLINSHVAAKNAEKHKYQLAEHLEKLEQELNRQPSSLGFTQLAQLYRAASQSEKEFQSLRKALELDPKNMEAQQALGFYYKRLGEYAKAVPVFENMLRFLPTDAEQRIVTNAELGESYKLWGQYDQAERVFKESINSFSRNPSAYGALGEIYLEQGRYPEAESLFEKQLEVNPRSVPIYGPLAYCYRRKGRFEAAERLLRQGIQRNPRAAVLYSELGYSLLESKKYSEAQAVLEKAMELNPQNDEGMARNLLASYEAQDKIERAQELRKKMLSQKENFILQLRENYQKIKTVLSQRGIPLVAVQYPLRSVKDLQQILDFDPTVLFVDNEQIFQEAVSREGYDEYFSDRFAGDFGHCTTKGNHLLASHIAKIILRQFSDP